MVYLIGGVARSGKSQLRKLLLTEYQLSGIGTDAIRYVLMKTNPNLGLSYDNTPDINGPIMWPYIESLVDEYLNNSNENYVIEGDVLLPELLKKYVNHSGVKVCFIGFSNTTSSQKARDIRNNADEDDWTNEYDQNGLENLAKWGIEQSIKYKEQCKTFGINYFDTGDNFVLSLGNIAGEITGSSRKA